MESMLWILGKRWLLKREPFLADDPDLLKEMIDIWLLRWLKVGHFEETTIMIGEAGGNNLSIWEKVVLRRANLKSVKQPISHLH